MTITIALGATITVALAAWIAWALAMLARTDTDGLNAGGRHTD